MTARDALVITLDADWAPDFVLRDAAFRLRLAGVPSTWFVTHPSPVWDELRRDPDLFELGIHPNFAPDSTQGGDISEIFSYLMQIVPEARCARSHGLYQSGSHLATMRAETPIRIDSSLFLPEHPQLQSVRHLTPSGALDRVPIYWADDYELLKPEGERWQQNRLISGPGLKVLLFHPIHVYLNSRDFEDYRNVQRYIGALADANEAALVDRRACGAGVGELFDELLACIRIGREAPLLSECVDGRG